MDKLIKVLAVNVPWKSYFRTSEGGLLMQKSALTKGEQIGAYNPAGDLFWFDKSAWVYQKINEPEKEAYDKKYELIDETYEFAKTTLRLLQCGSVREKFVSQEEFKKYFESLHECFITFRQIACEAVNKAYHANTEKAEA